MQARAIPVEVAAVKRGELQATLSVPARVYPGQQVPVVPQVAGRAVSVPVNLGDKVRAGQLLVALESGDYAGQVRQAEAALELAQAALSQARINYDNARENFARMESLYNDGAVSQQQYDAARHQLEVAEAQLQETAPAQVRQAQAALDLARNQLEKTRVTSPIAGIIGQLNVEKGQMVSPTGAVAVVVDLDTVRVRGEVSDLDVNKIAVGGTAAVRADAVPGYTFEGKVTSVQPVISQRGGFPVEIELDNPDGLLKAGMYAQASLVVDQREGVLVIPLKAIIERGGKHLAYVVESQAGRGGGAEGHAVARERALQLGLDDGEMVEVLSGLSEGDRLVVTGQDFLVDGAEVSVKGGDTGDRAPGDGGGAR